MPELSGLDLVANCGLRLANVGKDVALAVPCVSRQERCAVAASGEAKEVPRVTETCVALVE